MEKNNQDIARMLYEFGEFLAMQGVAFKPRAYEKAGETVAAYEEPLGDIYKKDGLRGILEIPGVGASIGEKIEEFLKTGKVRELETMRKRSPVNLAELSAVEGLGPKSIQKLNRELGISDLKTLETAAKSGKIRKLAGFGEKAEAKILKGIEFLKSFGGRVNIGKAMPEAKRIEERLASLPGVEKATVAGSLRRRRETIGDIDILVVAKDAEKVMEYFVSMPEVVNVSARGDTKSSIKIRSGLNVDLRVVETGSYGAALCYFTGSKDHNVRLRQIAIDKGLKLNEYGLYKGEKSVAGKTEEEIYEKLGLSFVPPEMRENTGEVEAALGEKLPKILGYGSLLGDLQVQTDWTDGSASIEEMATAAIKQGLSYIAITDHTKRLAMTNGLDEKRLLRQMAEIDRLNKKFTGKIRILKGSECDILKDGSLDISNEVLSKLDVVGVSVHSYFNLEKADQTKRIMRAMENRNADILFHPTGRVLGRREPYVVDMDALISKAKETGMIMEIDAYPDRLDLKDEHIRKCVEAGVKMSVDSDAHAVSHFGFLEYGVANARRGWAKKSDIINAWPVDKMLSFLKK